MGFNGPRTNQINIYFNDGEKAALDRWCDFYGISRADMLRCMLFICSKAPIAPYAMLLKAEEEGYLCGKVRRKNETVSTM